MAVFLYEALSKQGNAVKGEISANDEGSALARLQENGYLVLEIEEIKDKSKQGSLFSKRKKKVKIADLALFSRQLAAMLGAGIPVTQAISTLSQQTENETLKEAIADIASSIEGGLSLSDAFAKHKGIFSDLYIGMIGAGETGGILEEMLLRLSDQLQKDKQLSDNVKSATSYPKMIGIFAVVMFLAMLLLLVPVFEGFIPQNADIPVITAAVFALSHNIKDFWYVWILVIGAIAFGVMKFVKSKAGHDLWESKKLTMPLFGEILLKSVIARFSRTLATLLHGGLPVVQALESAGATSGSDLLMAAVREAIKKIEEGKNISKPLAESGIFPPMVINMIAIGEEAGTLPDLLDKIAEFYEEDVAVLTKQLGTLIEPLMLVLIGVVVGGMMVSMYLPIFTAVTAS